MDSANKEDFLKRLDECRPALSRFARAMTRDYEDAKDLVSETILKAYEGFDKLENKQAFQSFLFTIASRTYKRKLWRSRIFTPFVSKIHTDYQNEKPRADINLDIELLYKALNKINIKKREAITLFEISGFSIEEIAEMQGGTISGVKSRLKRAREELAILLKVRDEAKFLLHNINELPKDKNIKNQTQTNQRAEFEHSNNNLLTGKVKI